MLENKLKANEAHFKSQFVLCLLEWFCKLMASQEVC